MAVAQQLYTVEEFEAFTHLPENVDLKFEYVDGNIIEVPSNAYSSQIASIFIGEFRIYVKRTGSGHVTGEQGGYIVAGARLAPDAAYISKARQPHFAREGYNPNPLELAVEVISPNDKPEEIENKRLRYMEAGVLLWRVYPEREQIEIHKPGASVQIIGIDGTLDGGDILPGFTLAVREIFSD